VKLMKLDTNHEEIAIDVALGGPLRDVLELLDEEPLRFVRDLKIDPAQGRGPESTDTCSLTSRSSAT